MTRHVFALAKSLGATIETSRDPFEVTVEAPAGHVWTSDGVHEIVSSAWDRQSSREVWTDVHDRMRLGVERCPDTDCEWCAEGGAA